MDSDDRRVYHLLQSLQSTLFRAMERTERDYPNTAPGAVLAMNEVYDELTRSIETLLLTR